MMFYAAFDLFYKEICNVFSLGQSYCPQCSVTNVLNLMFYHIIVCYYYCVCVYVCVRVYVCVLIVVCIFVYSFLVILVCCILNANKVYYYTVTTEEYTGT